MELLDLAFTAGTAALAAGVALRFSAARARVDREQLAGEMQGQVHARTVECVELKARMQRVIDELDTLRKQGPPEARNEGPGTEALALALQAAQSECQELSSYCQDLERERDQRVGELMAQLHQLEPLLDELERRGQLLSDWERRNVQLGERQSELKAKLRAQAEQTKPLRRQLLEMRSELSSLERERDRLTARQSKLLERDMEHATLLQKQEERMQQLAAAARVDPQKLADYTALEAERDAYRDLLDGCLEQLEELSRVSKRERSRGERKSRELEKQLQSEGEQSAARLAELELVRAHLGDREAEIEALKSRCESIERDSYARIAGLAERIAELDALLAIRPRAQTLSGDNFSDLMRVDQTENQRASSPEPRSPAPRRS